MSVSLVFVKQKAQPLQVQNLYCVVLLFAYSLHTCSCTNTALKKMRLKTSDLSNYFKVMSVSQSRICVYFTRVIEVNVTGTQNCFRKTTPSPGLLRQVNDSIVYWYAEYNHRTVLSICKASIYFSSAIVCAKMTN